MEALSCVALPVFALVAGYLDYRSRRIPNWLTVSGALAGLCLSALVGWTPHFIASLQGFGAALGVGLILFFLRTLGAGDAKFMAAIGAWAGLARLPMAFLFMLGFGAASALAWSWRRKMLRATLASTATMVGGAMHGTKLGSPWVGQTESGRFPYGVGLGLGAIVWWLSTGCRLP
jgi:prepilin peptidase CpaA